jgi:hypothetical protein
LRAGGAWCGRAALGAPAMIDEVYKFKIGQTVGLVPSFRSGAKGVYQIVSLRPAEDGTKRYLIKSDDEAYQRVVTESDLFIPGMPMFDVN